MLIIVVICNVVAHVKLNCYNTAGCKTCNVSPFCHYKLNTVLVFRSTNSSNTLPRNTTHTKEANIMLPRNPIISQHHNYYNTDDMILNNRSIKSFVVQPIPPTLESINNRDYSAFQQSSGHRITFDYIKKSIDLAIPYTEEDLRMAASNSNNFSTAHTLRNRSEFYTADPHYNSYKSPILMDGFTYCEASALMVEVIFNLKYISTAGGKQKKLESIKDTWLCFHHGRTVMNMYPGDPHQHIIIAVFNFSNQCSTANDNHYEFRAVNNEFHYSLSLEFLPYFRVQRYYLSMCIFLSKAIEQQVIAFINYYYFHGVQHFVFNINGNLNYWRKLLKVYSDHGIVDIVDFEFPNNRWLHEQQVVMNSCNRRYRYTTQYMIQCDVDEFFLPLNSKWRVVDVVRLYSSAYPDIDAFSVKHALIIILRIGSQ